VVACSVSTALNGLVTGYPALLRVRALFAVSIAAIPGATMKMLAERVRPARRLTANGIMFGTTLAGGAVAPLLGAPVVEYAGWRTAFLLVAVVSLIAIPAVWLVPAPLQAKRNGTDLTPQQRTARLLTRSADRAYRLDRRQGRQLGIRRGEGRAGGMD